MGIAIMTGIVFFVLTVGACAIICDEVASRYRYWHVLNIEKLAHDRWACRLVAEALEIERDAGDPAEYVRWALLDALARRKEASRRG